MPLYNFRFTRLRGLTEPVVPVDPGTGGGTGGSGSNPGPGGPGLTVGDVSLTESGLMTPELLAKLNAAESLITVLTAGHASQEQSLDTLSQSMTNVIETIGFHGTHLENLDTLLQGYNGNVDVLGQHGTLLSTLSSNYDTLSGAVSTLTDSYTALTTTVGNNGSTLTAHSEAISDLEDEVGNLGSSLTTVNDSLTTVQQTLTSHGDRLTSTETVANTAATTAAVAASEATSLATTVGGLGSTSSNHTGRIEALETQQTAQGLTNTSVAGTLSAYNVRFEGIESSLTDMNTWAGGVNTSLGGLSTTVGNLTIAASDQIDAHNALAGRVGMVETGQGNLQSQLNGLNDTLVNQQGQLAAQATLSGDLGTDLATLETAHDALSDAHTALAATVGQQHTAISGRVDALESAVDALETAQGTITSLVTDHNALSDAHAALATTVNQKATELDTLETSVGALSLNHQTLSDAHNALALTVSQETTELDNLTTTVGNLSTAQTALSQTQVTQGNTITDHESRLDSLEAVGPGGGSGPVLKVTTTSSAAVYSFVKADADKYYRVTATVPATWTVQNQMAVAWVDGEELQLRNLGPETLTLVGDTAVTLVPSADGTLVLGAGMTTVLRRVGENLWDVFGQTESADPFDPDSKVDVVIGKGLSTNDYSDEEKNKLAGLAQADWNATEGQPGHILNKPASLGGQTIGDLRYSWMDFNASSAPWTGAAISSGTVTNTFSATMVTADPDFYGVVLMRCTATANTGYRITNATTQLHLMPGTHYTSRFMIPNAGMTTAWMINGLHDASGYADPVDGVYIKLSGLSCNFVASSNSVRTTGAAFSIVQLKWYVLHIDVISSSQVRFSVYNDTDNTLVFAETLTTNIPPANATRALGAGVVVVGSHLAVADVMALDWIGVGPVRHTAFGAII